MLRLVLPRQAGAERQAGRGCVTPPTHDVVRERFAGQVAERVLPAVVQVSVLDDAPPEAIGLACAQTAEGGSYLIFLGSMHAP